MNHITLKNPLIKEKNELKEACDILYGAKNSRDFKEFYTFLRTTQLPFIPCNGKDTENIHESCFKILLGFGEISIPVAIALSMHYYILASIANYPLPKTSKTFWKREILLNKIRKERALIANTGSVRSHRTLGQNSGIWAKKEQGGYLINGQAPFMSLSGIADYLVFTATLNTYKKAVFFAPYSDTEITFEKEVFKDAMLGSFTKSVRFTNLWVDNALAIDLEETIETHKHSELLVYQRAWFQTLASAPYLGGAQRMISHLKEFGRKKIKNGKKLSESERFEGNLGKLILKYRTALQLCKQSGIAISNFKKADKASLKNILESSLLSKFYSTQFAEEIVSETRLILGTHFFTDPLLDNLGKQVQFGALQPMTNPDIEYYFSKAVL
ncbi:MAG: acyl-CoA dehydrogenase family protein [Bacteroidota bacterium]